MMIKILLFLIVTLPLSATLQEAYQKYNEAERSKNVDERRKLFNEALTLYLQAEPKNPSDKFSYNIANCYFQLGEYGYAILYYNKALKRNPRDARIQYNLKVANRKAGVEEPARSILLFFHYALSHNEKITIALVLFFCIFALLSWYIWTDRGRLLALILLAIAAAFVSSIVWLEYLAPPEAIIIHPTPLKVDAGYEYANVANSKLLSGLKVQVLDSENQGSWLKIHLPSGQEGFVTKENFRII